MEPKCETCADSGYVWRTGPDGREWMCDCDSDECDAFGQLDGDVEDESEEK